MEAVSKSLIGLDFENVFMSIASKAIATKNKKCKDVKKPIWLAMHDSYFSYKFSDSKEESIELYKKTIKDIDFGIFEKIIITFGDKGIGDKGMRVFDKPTTYTP